MEVNSFLYLREDDIALLSKFYEILKEHSEEFSNRLVGKILSKEETKKLIERTGILESEDRTKKLILNVSEFYISMFKGDKEVVKKWFLRIAKVHFKNLVPPEYVISLSSFIVDFTVEKLVERNINSGELVKVSLALSRVLSEGVSIISYIFYESLIKILGIRRGLLIRLAKHGSEKL